MHWWNLRHAKDDPREKQMLNTMFKLRGSQSGRCCAPDVECGRLPVSAHSVQNATALDLIVENGHVVAPSTLPSAMP